MTKYLAILTFWVAVLFTMQTTIADTDSQETRGQRILVAADESPRKMLARCCWAGGRNAFHFCSEYGICSRDGKETCVGVGAAEGLQLSCTAPPPDLDAKAAARL